MIRQIGAAFAFLTRIPVPAFTDADGTQLGKSARWFPLVGLVLGGLYAATAVLCASRLPASVVAAFLVGLDALLTGGLHLDGLADMVDGFGGGRTREDVLRIMRDHAIGSYGGIALICFLLLKYSCLTQLVADRQFSIVIVIPALSRWAIVFLSHWLPYARSAPNSGLVGTGAVAQAIGKIELIVATIICLSVPLVVGLFRTVICWATVILVSVLVGFICRRRIGGITGDILGANTVISEAVQLTVALLIHS